MAPTHLPLAFGNSFLKDFEAARDVSQEALERLDERRLVERALARLAPEHREMIDHVLIEEAPGEDFDTEVQAMMDQAAEFLGRTEYGYPGSHANTLSPSSTT